MRIRLGDDSHIEIDPDLDDSTGVCLTCGDLLERVDEDCYREVCQECGSSSVCSLKQVAELGRLS